MEIRKATANDLDEILRVYASAQDFMIRSGNPHQWGRRYPTRALLEADIRAGNCFVCTENGTPHGVFVLRFDEEPTYGVIEDGAWPNGLPYITIHRVASDGAVPGVFSAAVAFCRALSDCIRIDTHRDNEVMQRHIAAEGFRYCGIIRLADGSPRLAYQWDKQRRFAPQQNSPVGE